MVVICISDVAKFLNKATFYDILINFEDFCYYIDKKFKKTYKIIYMDIEDLTIDDNIEEKFPNLKKENVKQIESLVNKNHGTINEHKHIPEDVECQVKFRKQVSEHIILSGVVDYIDNGIIYEVKCRSSRLFKRIYEYEKIQIQLYMHVSNIKKAKLKENYKDDEYIIEMEYDEEYCLDIINQLILYHNVITKFLNNTEDYYKTQDKLAFIKQLRGF